MDKTLVSVYFVPHKKEERYQFKRLQEVYPFIRNSKINTQQLFSEFSDEMKYIILKPDQSSQLGIVGQKIILEDRREFIRKVAIRYDDSKHGGIESHINLDLLTIYPSANKTEKDKLSQTHRLFLKNKGIQTLHVILSVPGSSIRRSVVILPTFQDKEYHENQGVFLQKLKTKTLTNEDEIKFKNQSHVYHNYISGNS